MLQIAHDSGDLLPVWRAKESKKRASTRGKLVMSINCFVYIRALAFFAMPTQMKREARLKCLRSSSLLPRPLALAPLRNDDLRANESLD